MAVGGCFAFTVAKAAPISKRERINATLQTIVELQDIFGCSSASLAVFEKLDDIRVIVKEMQRH
jgi:hypothetical protein